MKHDERNSVPEHDPASVAARNDQAAAAGKGLFDEADETHYRTHFESDASRPADRRYEDVRPYYALGHSAAQHPDYQGREFDDIETDLQKGTDQGGHAVDWAGGRGYARAAFTRQRLATEGRLGGGAGNAANIAGGNVSSQI